MTFGSLILRFHLQISLRLTTCTLFREYPPQGKARKTYGYLSKLSSSYEYSMIKKKKLYTLEHSCYRLQFCKYHCEIIRLFLHPFLPSSVNIHPRTLVQTLSYPDMPPPSCIQSSARGRMVLWYAIWAVLPSRVWVAWTHAPLETGESWFESSETRTLLLSR